MPSREFFFKRNKITFYLILFSHRSFRILVREAHRNHFFIQCDGGVVSVSIITLRGCRYDGMKKFGSSLHDISKSNCDCKTTGVRVSVHRVLSLRRVQRKNHMTLVQVQLARVE